ncbi:hypothetical protein BD414DRAFT_575850 [Trametes punicea]|nr:hypothetical protein BD414DRAFT_575850 [Trametes punicea]
MGGHGRSSSSTSLMFRSTVSRSRVDHPFNDPSADIVFRSSDKVHFKVHKIILSLASDFFRDMFSLPQPESPSPHPGASSGGNSGSTTAVLDGLPVVPVTENSAVLDNLFRLCYPISDPSLNNVDDVRLTLEAAMKYQMTEAIDIATRKLLDLVPSDPLRVYLVACQMSLQAVIPVAARGVFDQRKHELYVKELEEVPVSVYHRLLSYCSPCEFAGDRQALPNFAAFDVEYAKAPARPNAAEDDSENDATDAVEPERTFGNMKLEPGPTNVTIRASDGTRFTVPKSILPLVSPVLMHLSSVSSSSDSSPVLNVPETSRVMTLLFDMCAPNVEPSDFLNHEEIVAALDAAEKYLMQKPAWYLRNALIELGDHPSVDVVWLYFVACRFNLCELAKTAARRSLRMDLIRDYRPNVDSLGVAAGSLWRLLDYHRRCRAAVRSVVDTRDTSWISAEWRNKLDGLSSLTHNMPCWRDRLLTEIARERWPSGASASKGVILRAAIHEPGGGICIECTSPKSVLLLFGFSKHVGKAMEARENQVELAWRDFNVCN